MSRRQRLRRADPKRAGPIRNWQTLLRRSDSWNSREPLAPGDTAADAADDGAWNDTVSRGVKLGYSVIEEQIRQGQRIAQEINDRSYTAGAMDNNVGKLLERVLRFYTDVGSLCFELVESTLRNPGVSGIFRTPGTSEPSNDASHNSQWTNGATAVSIEVASTRPTEVTLDLRPHANGSALAVHELRALDTQKPPLTEVRFESGSENGPPRVRIAIPEAQPPDIYTGALIDRETNEPRGTLSIRIGE